MTYDENRDGMFWRWL